MSTESLEVWRVVPAPAQQIFQAWLDSGAHSAFTQQEATIDPVVGGMFTAGDGYIRGRTLELDPGRRIVQAWRSTEFPPDSPDSRLELSLEEVEGGTRVRLLHTQIPQGQRERYAQGWLEFYLKPLARYFTGQPEDPSAEEDREEPPSAARRPSRAPAAKRPAARAKPAAVRRSAAARKSGPRRSPTRGKKPKARQEVAKRAAGKRVAAKKSTAKKGKPKGRPSPRRRSR